MDTLPYKTFSEVTRSFLNERGDYSEQKFERFMQIVIEGYTQMNIQRVFACKKFYTTVNSAGIAKMPADCIDYVEISLLDNNLLWPISFNKMIAPPKEGACLVDEVSEFNNEELPDSRGQVYGAGGSYNVGEFDYDKQTRLITFRGSRVINREIFTRYLSSGVSLSGKTLIPIEVMPMLKGYLDYTLKRNDDDMPAWKIRMAFDHFSLMKIEYSNFKNKTTLAQIINAMAAGWHH